MNDRPEGERFTRLYRERGEPTQDSRRARRRIASWLDQHLAAWEQAKLSDYVRAEMGIDFFPATKSLDGLDLDDFLDIITVIAHGMTAFDGQNEFRSLDFVDFAARVFTSENLSFEVDRLGGVHYRIDSEFTQNLQSTIAGLGTTRFTQATNSLAEVQPSLDRQDTRGAIRHVFDAAENVFKVIMGRKAQRLGAEEIRNLLKPHVQRHYEGAALQASLKMTEAFQDWTASAHFYRHVEGTEDAPPPPMELAILLVSQGASWVRWLVSIDPDGEVESAELATETPE